MAAIFHCAKRSFILSFFHSFIQPFIQQVLINSYNVPDTLASAQNKKVTHNHKSVTLLAPRDPGNLSSNPQFYVLWMSHVLPSVSVIFWWGLYCVSFCDAVHDSHQNILLTQKCDCSKLYWRFCGGEIVKGGRKKVYISKPKANSNCALVTSISKCTFITSQGTVCWLLAHTFPCSKGPLWVLFLSHVFFLSFPSPSSH